MKQGLLRNIIIVCFVFLLPLAAFPYDNDIVHPEINEVASRRSSNLATVLQMLGFDKGVDSIVYDKEIYLWFRDGGKREDEPVCRTKFHFHDPVKPFGDAGLNDIVVDLGCMNFNHYSSLAWAQNDDNLASWQKARLNYLGALTGTDKDVREGKLADTFKALGQVMHLVSDSSVPAHVRNDAHVLVADQFEAWAAANHGKLSYTGIPVNQSIFNQAVNDALAPVPISALWDIDKYKGNNPEETVGTNIGIAEYTNANFFSDDTISREYSYPNWTSVSNQIEDSGIIDPRDPTRTVTRQYFKKDKHGDAGYRLSTVPFLVEYFTDLNQLETLRIPAILDGEVFTDYASKLIPRAVGYSAGLLDYFFRGKIEMSPSEDGSGYVIENKTEEDMDGTFELYYDATDNQRKQCWSGSFALGALSSGNNKSDTIAFTPPDDAKEPGKYILVFLGRLGKEDGAVVGAIVNLPSSSFVLLSFA